MDEVIDSFFTFAHSNDFVVVVFVLALFLIIAGCIFRAFFKAAIITVIVLFVLSFGVRHLPQPIIDYFGLTDNTESNIDKVIDKGSEYVDEKANDLKNKLHEKNTENGISDDNNLGSIED